MDTTVQLIAGLAIIGLLFVAVSVTSPTKAERAAWQTQIFSASKDTIIQASIDYLQNQGYPIGKINKDAGFISTGYASQEQLQGVAVGMLMEALTGEKRFKATVTVLPTSDGQNKVRVKLIAESRDLFYWSSQSATYYGKQSYEKFFNGLREKVRQMK